MINVLGLILAGLASHYSDGVMQEVLHNRQVGRAWVSLPMELPAHDGLIAVRDCGHLGEIWLLRPVSWPTWERHLVVDCARPAGYDGSREWMTQWNVMVEVSYSTGKRWESVGELTGVERFVVREDLRDGQKTH